MFKSPELLSRVRLVAMQPSTDRDLAQALLGKERSRGGFRLCRRCLTLTALGHNSNSLVLCEEREGTTDMAEDFSPAS